MRVNTEKRKNIRLSITAGKRGTMKIGDKIKAARKKAGMTQKELAEMIHVTPRCIQYYEGNIRKPQSTEIIIKLAAALNEEVHYFLSEKELELMRENELFLGEAEHKFGQTGESAGKKPD